MTSTKKWYLRYLDMIIVSGVIVTGLGVLSVRSLLNPTDRSFELAKVVEIDRKENELLAPNRSLIFFDLNGEVQSLRSTQEEAVSAKRSGTVCLAINKRDAKIDWIEMEPEGSCL